MKRVLEKQLAVTDAGSDFEGHPHWQLVQRILASPQFARSPRLKTFLQYVTRCALLDRAEQVTEQQIGMHVFGRPADYHAGDDNIVRSQARFLRIKLTEYFESASGRDEPVVLTIPKGTYLPRFEHRTEVVTASPVTPLVEPSAPPEIAPEITRVPPSRSVNWRVWGATLTVVACLLAGAYLLRQRFISPKPDLTIWSRLFAAHIPTTIVASDYIFSMVQEAAGRNLSLDEYLSADYFNRVARINSDSGLEHLFPNIALRHYTGFENVTNVVRLMGLKEAQSAHTVVRFARDLTMRDVDSGNMILIGSKQSNPWDLLFEKKLNFRFEYRLEEHSVFIQNRSPRSGEEPEYRPSPLDALSRVIYGGIAFLPNLNRGSNVLILQGTSMGGSEKALEFLGNPALFRDLIARVSAGRHDRELPYFEALIRTNTLNGVAGESAIVAYRILGE